MSAQPPLLASLRPSDLRGLAGVATQVTLDVTGIVEGVHHSVLKTIGLQRHAGKGKTGGLTGLVYGSINGITRLAGTGIGIALNATELLARGLGHQPGDSDQRDGIIAAVNGVLGDQLAASANPLAIDMALRSGGETIDWQDPTPLQDASGKVLILIHGLCMTDHHWISLPAPGQPSHGEALADAHGYTPVYLRYNSGLPIAHNGRKLATELELLLDHWPVDIEELSLLGHSMGGLLARSAAHQAETRGMKWPEKLQHMVFLGSPHQGAPLERAGAWVDHILNATPYTRPFSAIGSRRSAGIQDLRFGRVLDDSNDITQSEQAPSPLRDTRQPCPLPAQAKSWAIAATRSDSTRRSRKLAGDGLVPVSSALGGHSKSLQDLGLGEESMFIVPETHHLELLNSPTVTKQLMHWLKP